MWSCCPGSKHNSSTLIICYALFHSHTLSLPLTLCSSNLVSWALSGDLCRFLAYKVKTADAQAAQKHTTHTHTHTHFQTHSQRERQCSPALGIHSHTRTPSRQSGSVSFFYLLPTKKNVKKYVFHWASTLKMWVKSRMCSGLERSLLEFRVPSGCGRCRSESKSRSESERAASDKPVVGMLQSWS